MTNLKLAKKLIAEMFRVSGRLTKMTGRPFTLDGHMIGSIGEVYAQLHYGVELFPPSHRGHDGSWNGREVQIKATQRDSVDLKGVTDLLLVFQIKPDGTFIEIYNGDGKRPWQSLTHRKVTKAGEISISIRQLRELDKQVTPTDRILRTT